jgi:ABC-type multidrug transport system fused ATPase/permease subunit
MQNGRIAQAGRFDELLKQNIGFEVLVGAHSEALESILTVENSSKTSPSPTADDESNIDSTFNAELLHTQNDSEHNLSLEITEKASKFVQDEEREKGSIGKDVYWSYLTTVKGGALVPFILLAQSSFQVLQIASNVLVRATLVALAGLWTSQKLFTNMLHSVLRAPMAFFDSTPFGRILNRVTYTFTQFMLISVECMY